MLALRTTKHAKVVLRKRSHEDPHPSERQYVVVHGPADVYPSHLNVSAERHFMRSTADHVRLEQKMLSDRLLGNPSTVFVSIL